MGASKSSQQPLVPYPEYQEREEGAEFPPLSFPRSP
jgi:hypothetical protein